jgi:hypothetical protein
LRLAWNVFAEEYSEYVIVFMYARPGLPEPDRDSSKVTGRRSESAADRLPIDDSRYTFNGKNALSMPSGRVNVTS